MELALAVIVVFILGTCFGAFVTYKAIVLAFDSIVPVGFDVEEEERR